MKPYKQNRIKTVWARVRYFLSLAKVRLLGRLDPVICVLVVNSRCNFNCKYCFGNYARKQTPDYTTGELKGLIDELYKMGTRYLNIHGGETLLRDDIGEIVDHIKSKGIYCCLITNGSLLRQKINAIRNVDNLTISIDGRRENNDRNRGIGTFDMAVAAIKLALREKIPLRVSATITRHTMNDVEYLADFARELGFSLYFSILFKPLPQAKDMEMSSQEIREAAGKIKELKSKGYPIFTSYKVLKYAMDWPLDHNKHHYLAKSELNKLPKDFKKIKCYYGKNKFTIEPDGNVYPCFLLIESFKALNWKEVGIRKAIEHVRNTNDCLTCPAFSQNDHNLLMDLDIKHIFFIIADQIRESFKRE